MNTEQTAALLREAERRGLPATNCSRWPSGNGPNPGGPEPGGPGNAGGSAAPLAWTHRPRRQAVGLVEQERQP